MDAPDELEKNVRVMYDVVEGSGPDPVPLSRPDAHVMLAIDRSDGIYDALIVSVDPKKFSGSALFGARLRCCSVSLDTYIDTPAKFDAHCVVLYKNTSPLPSLSTKFEAARREARTPSVPLIESTQDASPEILLRRIVACCVEKDDMKAAVQAGVAEDVAAARLSIEDPGWVVEDPVEDPPESGVWKVTVRATYKAPPVPQGMEEEEAARGPSWEQKKVAEALLRRTRAMLGGEQAFDKFTDMQFLILVPAFTTLKAQTAYRVRRARLTEYGSKDDEFSKVIMHSCGDSAKYFEQFKAKALKDEGKTTLFVIIADECHYSPTRGGYQSVYVNDEQLLGLPNLVVLLNSATPFNCLTRKSRITGPLTSDSWCDPLSLEPGHEDPTSNIIRWRPNGRGRYRDIDFFVNSIAFSVPEGKRKMSLTYQVQGGVETAVPIELSGRFGSMQHVAMYITDRLVAAKAPVICKYDKKAKPEDNEDTGRFVFLAAKSVTVWIRLREGDVLQLLGFTQFDSDLPLAPSLVAAKPADVDRDHPIAAQRVRSDTNFADKFSRFNGRFGTRTKRTKTKPVGELVPRFGGKSKGRKATQGGEAKPIVVQDGHLFMCDYLLSLAYYAILRVRVGWHQPGAAMLLDLNESERRLTQAESIDGLFGGSVVPAEELSAPVGAHFRTLLRRLAVGEPGLAFCNGMTLKSYDMTALLVDHLYEKELARAMREITEEEEEDNEPTPPRLITDEDEDEALRYIFKQKLAGEREAKTTTDEEGWFTETDRNVLALLDQKRNKRGCVWGQMILMRVYENQENMTMQTVLRDALEKLGLAAPGGSDVRAFSVLSDIAETVIAEAIEPYFFKHFDLHRALGSDSDPNEIWGFDRNGEVCKLPEDSPPLTLKDILDRKLASYQRESAQGVRAPRAELSYSDLHNVPMLLIVTEKARMGDTFPHSLVSLDLRLRTAGTLVAFTQELGRMCRYPATRLLHDATKPLSVSGVLAALGVLDRGGTAADATSAAAAKMSGATEADTAAAAQAASDAASDARRLLELELPMMVVLAGGTDQDIVAHVHSLPELRAELCKLLDPQLRNRDDPLNGSVVTHFDLHCYFDRLPRAIVRQDVQKLLVAGIDAKQSKAPRSREITALQCVKMKEGLDMYMRPIKGKLSNKAMHDSGAMFSSWKIDDTFHFEPTSFEADGCTVVMSADIDCLTAAGRNIKGTEAHTAVVAAGPTGALTIKSWVVSGSAHHAAAFDTE